jgi:hypothetical protein
MTKNIEELLKATPLTDSENNRYASIKRVALANRKSENQRHADAIGAIEAREPTGRRGKPAVVRANGGKVWLGRLQFSLSSRSKT